jgi:DNA-binding MarR family transcriptional regulator
MAAMDSRVPLLTLLSYALVAFTIEFDNEFEHLMQHRTTRHGRTAGSFHAPWLVSLAMWSNCMRFVDEKGITVRDLERRACTKTNLNGMERWGYIIVAPDPADRRPKPSRSDWLIRATPSGRRAKEIWQPLPGVIEKRWRERFDDDAIDQLRQSLSAVVAKIDLELPDCLPILGYGLFSKDSNYKQRPADEGRLATASSLPLYALLSKVLLAFAIDFELDSVVSLAISANVLRFVDQAGARVADLPTLSGASKEAITTSVGYLQRHGYAVIESLPAPGRGKLVRLTAKGVHARETYLHLLDEIEPRWQERFGKESIRNLRSSLHKLVGEPTRSSPLFRGLEPYPDGWRASTRKPDTLPHYPLVLHRGGYPDGS